MTAPVKTQYGYHLIFVRSRGPITFDDVKDQLAASVTRSASSLVQPELARAAAAADITVDGRFGRFDPTTAQIAAPDGAAPPPTSAAGDTDPLAGLQSP